MIRLERFEAADFATLISWVDSPETLMQFAGPNFTYPLTADQLTIHLKDANRKVFKVVAVESGEYIGHAEIFLTEHSAFLSRLLIGKRENRGAGTGLEIVRALLQIIFNQTAKTKAELNVFDWNTPAIACYRKAGFQIHPTKNSERHINGQTWVALNMFLEK